MSSWSGVVRPVPPYPDCSPNGDGASWSWKREVVISFARFFYGPSKKVIEYFEEARKLVEPDEALSARQYFVSLISGLYDIEPIMEGVPAAPSVAAAN
jgi:hypothetical protein